MGAVFLAEHPLIGKRVALKVIHHELSANRDVVSRFFNEARAVNQIGNEHIVQVNDLGRTDDGQYFLVMEYLDGRTLAAVLTEEGLLAVDRALRITAEIASGLAAAHSEAIIHRDLKPDNIMLVPRRSNPDFVKVLDFGLAKVLAETATHKLTGAGVVLGTPQYMSPEACESDGPVDHRTDIYSLGVLMFQMLTGHLPFNGRSMGEVLVKQVTQPPPALRGLNPEVPPAVEQIVFRCLAKDRDQRFADMIELREAVLDADSYLASSPPIMPSAPPDAQTMFIDSGSGAAVSPHQAGAGKTAYMPDGLPIGAPPAALGAVPSPVALQPRPPGNATMYIGTPEGYSDQPPRRGRPWVVVGVAVIGIAAGLIALRALDGSASAPAGAQADEIPVKALPAADAGAVTPPFVAPADAALSDAALELARVTLTTTPAGAIVLDENGVELGVTPTEIEIPIDGGEHTLEFRHPRAVPRKKTFSPTGDTAVAIELEPIVHRPPKRSPGKREKRHGHNTRTERKSAGDKLLRPTF